MNNTGICEFSPCRQYRYVLMRDVPPEPLSNCNPSQNIHGPYCECKSPGADLLVIGLNPSTADETKNDPTIRRCIGFAQTWGFQKLTMMNIFAFRATVPGVMKCAIDPIGPLNDRRLIEIALNCQARGGIILAAWGTNGAHRNRQTEVKAMMAMAGVQLMCLRKTAEGFPEHPLYIPGNTIPIPFS